MPTTTKSLLLLALAGIFIHTAHCEEAGKDKTDAITWKIRHLDVAENNLMLIGLTSGTTQAGRSGEFASMLVDLKDKHIIGTVPGAFLPKFTDGGKTFFALTDDATLSHFDSQTLVAKSKHLLERADEYVEFNNIGLPRLDGYFPVENNAAIIYFTDSYLGRFSLSDKHTTFSAAPPDHFNGYELVSCSLASGNRILTVQSEDQNEGGQIARLEFNLWDQKSLKKEFSWSVPREYQGVRAAAISPNGQHVAAFIVSYPTVNESVSQCFLWNLSADRPVQKTIWFAQGDRLEVALSRTIAFSADSNYLAIQTEDDDVVIYSVENGERVKTLHADSHEIDTVQFAPSGQSLFAGATKPKRCVVAWHDLFKTIAPSKPSEIIEINLGELENKR